ncbi:hypothetical protein SDC9_162233 [bioreactor metagenome]|uniref:FMN-binding domain-containing protein n=1 Tax=bioreactor metagenome TaxID=1076179 RepID=A0A645FRU5_9ZZZZ|nr:FMN-binding protein [Candidatus Metalachnospira sp.]
MILGIITAMVFVLVSAVFFTKKLSNDSRIRKLFSVIHKPLGYLLVVLAIAHLVLTLPLIKQRPIIIYILGIAMIICVIVSIMSWNLIKDKRKALFLHKISAFIIVPLIIAHIAFCVASLNKYQQKIAAISFSNPQISAIADGEYIGECNVGYIYAKVEVSVSNGVINNIELLDHHNERGEAGEGVIAKILAEQRIDVDAVASATNSSKVIKKAVENAIEKGLVK